MIDLYTNAESLVILRMEDEKFDIIGILIAVSDDTIALEDPFLVDYNPLAGEMAVQPYCALAECSIFEFKRSKIKVLTGVRSGIAKVFLEGIRDINESLEYTPSGGEQKPDTTEEEDQPRVVRKSTLH
jgi:hypothetical protein